MSKRGIVLNPSQVHILRALARHRGHLGMTRSDIEKACPSATVSSSNLGLSRTEAVSGSLYDLGYVSAEEHDDDGRDVVYYRITQSGRQAAAQVVMLDRSDKKVDSAVLDRVVIQFRKTRTYGIDNYTDDDLREIRGLLKDHARDVPLADLRQLIANRRKQGAYADPREKVKRAARAALQAFGADGWVHDCLLPPDVVEVLEEIARTGVSQ